MKAINYNDSLVGLEIFYIKLLIGVEYALSLKDEIVDAEIWRYMDFAKFVSLLTNESLYFCKLKNLDDPWEGEWSVAYEDVIKKMIRDSRPPSTKDDTEDMLAQTLNGRNIFYDYIYINCWHINDYESDAMWKLYSLNKEGIAIKTTIHKLCDQLDKQKKDFHIKPVKYIDYSKELLNDESIVITAPVFWKSKAFEHEHELRIALLDEKFPTTIYHKDDPKNYANPSNGINIKVNLIDFVDAIYVSPIAPSWVFSTINKLLDKYKLNISVNYSTLLKPSLK